MSTKSNRKIVLLLSDSHAWYSLGLCNPDAPTNPETNLNAFQQWLWNDVYLDGIEKTKELAGKDEIEILHIGDITHGDKYLSDQMSVNMSPQLISAAYNFVPLLDISNVKKLRIAVGTPAHNFGESSTEDVVTEILSSKYPKKDIKSLYHGILNIDGFRIDYAHHGPPPGSRNWLKGNVARLYLLSAMMTELDMDRVPANLFVRGHYHTYVKEWARIVRKETAYESWILIMPPLCIPNAHAIQVTRSVPDVHVGMIALEIVNGRLHNQIEFIQTLPLIQEEQV